MAFPTAQPPPAAASSAGTLVLLALIFQLFGAVLLFLAFYWFVGFSIFSSHPYGWFAITVVTAITAGVALLLVFGYLFSYRRIEKGDYIAAQTPTLVLGILEVITLNLISGVLYLIGYVKLGDAIRAQQATAAGYGPPAVTAPSASLIACKGCGRVFPFGSFAFCPNCGQKLGS